jgi:ferrous iron transport protein A
LSSGGVLENNLNTVDIIPSECYNTDSHLRLNQSEKTRNFMDTPLSAKITQPARESRFDSLRRRFLARQTVPMNLGEPDETGHVEMALSQMRPGEQGHILSVCTDCEVRQHLMELGFIPGSAIEFVRVAPLGDPLIVRLRGYQLSLRRREADAVRVRRCPPEFDDPDQGE